MTEQEIISYKHFIRDMTDDQLDAETSTVISQDAPDKALLIQFVYTEWLNRGKGERFVKAYNKVVGEVSPRKYDEEIFTVKISNESVMPREKFEELERRYGSLEMEDAMKSAYGSPPFAQGGIVQGGTPVSVNNTEGMALSSEQVADLEKLVKEINIEGRS